MKSSGVFVRTSHQQRVSRHGLVHDGYRVGTLICYRVSAVAIGAGQKHQACSTRDVAVGAAENEWRNASTRQAARAPADACWPCGWQFHIGVTKWHDIAFDLMSAEHSRKPGLQASYQFCEFAYRGR